MAAAVILLTGATGFVGKVVLAELLRRRSELGWKQIHLAIRPKTAKDGRLVLPGDRLEELRASKAFSRIPTSAWAGVHALPCDLSAPGMGLNLDEFTALAKPLSHIIHAAASVDFWLPIQEAAHANITAALSVLALAKAAPALQSMVSVSTAYVTPHPGDASPILEQLPALPFDPQITYEAILSGQADEEALMKATGHPNTYTLTKAIAEHLLVAGREQVPLTIVRPSVVSAAIAQPLPGWIDSKAAFAGGVLMVGLGLARAFLADPDAKLDVVPVDAVADRILAAAFPPKKPDHPSSSEGVPILFAAVGPERAMALGWARDATVAYFSTRPAGRRPDLRFFGSRAQGFDRAERRHVKRPLLVLKAMARLKGDAKTLAKLHKLEKTLHQINRGFEAFTAQAYHFQPAQALPLPGFNPQSYAWVVAKGLATHLLQRDESFQSLAGKNHDHDDARGDLAWTRQQGKGKAWVLQALGYGLRKLMRRTTQGVSFDRPSFEAALANIPAGSAVVLAPTHRSYADFLLVPYLLFAHPELGLGMPGIAAAREFARIPVLGKILAAAGAFFVDRGVGRAQPELEASVAALAKADRPLLVFVEGQRSRSRRQLAPKRGVLRALASTGRPVVAIPIAISYERLPEEAAFAEELQGKHKAKMRWAPLLRWLRQAWAGKVALGHVHLSAGQAICFQGTDAVAAAAKHLVAEQAACMAVPSTHLKAFMACHPELMAQGVDELFLQQCLQARGRVVHPGAAHIHHSPELEATFRQSWWRSFAPELEAWWGGHPAVAYWLKHQLHGTTVLAPTETDPRAVAVAHALVAPLAEDFRRVARRLGRPGQRLAAPSPLAVLAVEPAAHLPHLEDAYGALREAGILSLEGGQWAWGPHAEQLSAWHDACALPAPGPFPSRAEAKH